MSRDINFSTLRPGFLACALLLGACAGGAPVPPPATELVAAVARPARWDSAIVNREAAWYGSAEARAIADAVLHYQSAEGGWPKNTDLSVAPLSPADRPAPALGNTIDNHGTTLPMQFLARIITARPDPRYLQAFNRGFDYLIAAQYPNGGWPQFYPLREGYWSRITYNDDAMVRVMRLLRDAASGRAPYGFVDPERRARAAAAVARATALTLKTQIVQDGRLTAWAAQYDEHSLAPAGARSFEPASLSGSESVGIVRYLMSLDDPSPEVVAAVEGAIAWFEAVKITGMRLEDFTDAQGEPDRRLVPDPAAPPLWARFYDLRSNAPIFMGRDSVRRAGFAELERDRRAGYAYLGTWPAALIARDYPKWRERIGR